MLYLCRLIIILHYSAHTNTYFYMKHFNEYKGLDLSAVSREVLEQWEQQYLKQ